MRKFVNILLLALLSVFFIDADGGSGRGSIEDGVHERLLVEVCGDIPDSGTLEDKGCPHGGYNDWNLPELSSGQMQFQDGRVRTQGARVRTFDGNSGCGQSSFLKSGKVSSIRKALSFIAGTGLYPSGFSSFSHHFISLRKMRL